MNPCACGHSQDDHQPDCQLPISGRGGITFCECSSYRVEPVTARMSPVFEYRLRHTAHEKFLPRWMHRAACAGMNGGPETTWDAAFHDEVGMEQDPADYSWPEDVKTVMQLCARCPVRKECLEYAFETTKEQVLGDATFYVSHEIECRDPKCAGCVPKDKRLRRQPFSVEPMHMGVFGGCPGRIREHFARFTDAVRRCEEWFRGEARRMRWELAEDNEEKTA